MLHQPLDAFGVIERKGEEGDADDVVTKAVADLTKTVNDRIAAVEQKADTSKLLERLDRLEAKANRPVQGADLAAPSIERKAFEQMLRKGVERMPVEEVKALTVGTDTAGGFLAPDEFGAELLKLLVQFSPVRQFARVVNIGSDQIKYPKRTAGAGAAWVSETGARTGSEPTYAQVSIPAHELATFVDASNAILEDNAYNLESELLTDFAEAFGKAEGTAFVNGTGTGQPTGILTASGIASVNSGNTSQITADGIMKAFHAIPQVFAQAGVWVMNRNTLSAIRLLKDGQGRYLLADPLSATAPSTILGRPVVEMPDMPDIAAAATGAPAITPVVFGDMSGYRIADRVGLSVLRDPYSQAANGIVRFHARKRVGADLTHADRFVKIAIAA